MLNPFIYDRIVPVVDERVNKHLKPYVKRRPSCYKRAVAGWDSLTHDQKCFIVELVERIQKDSIAKAMMRELSSITVPKVGKFIFSPAKFFYINHKEELEKLSKEERKSKIIAYHIEHKRKRRTAIDDGKKMRFRKDITKR